jgi:hypothetical protein
MGRRTKRDATASFGAAGSAALTISKREPRRSGACCAPKELALPSYLRVHENPLRRAPTL